MSLADSGKGDGPLLSPAPFRCCNELSLGRGPGIGFQKVLEVGSHLYPVPQSGLELIVYSLGWHRS